MFKRRHKKQSVVNSNSLTEKNRPTNKLGGRFFLDLDSLAEEKESVMQLPIQAMLILNSSEQM